MTGALHDALQRGIQGLLPSCRQSCGAFRRLMNGNRLFLAEFLEVTPRCCQAPFLVNFDMAHGRAQRSASREIDVGDELSSFARAQANVEKLEMCAEGTSGSERSCENCSVGLAAGSGNEDGFHLGSPQCFNEPPTPSTICRTQSADRARAPQSARSKVLLRRTADYPRPSVRDRPPYPAQEEQCVPTDRRSTTCSPPFCSLESQSSRRENLLRYTRVNLSHKAECLQTLV